MIKLRANTQSISAKIEDMRAKAQAAALNKILSVAQDAAQVSPVDTGAFVESWSVLPKGSGAGRSKSSKTPERRAVSGKLTASQKQAIRDTHKGVLADDLKKHRLTILKSGGAIIRNRAPHQPYVEARRQILPYVTDRNS